MLQRKARLSGARSIYQITIFKSDDKVSGPVLVFHVDASKHEDSHIRAEGDRKQTGAAANGYE